MNWKGILKVQGLIGILIAFTQCIPLIHSITLREDTSMAFGASILICLIAGSSLLLFNRKASNQLGKRDGYLIVFLSWLFLCITGSLPYFFSDVITSSSSAFFESVSGFTTTGATVFSNIEELPGSILLWRSLTQWIGGMGIIVLTVAIFPLLGIGGVELFVAEAPGPTNDKIHPRIKEVAKRLWLIYISLTALLFLLLKVEGMTYFDAFNHSLTTMATGGFSTKDSSLAAFTNPLIHYTILLFMFIAGTNYTIIYFGLKRKFSKVWSSDEFKAYVIVVGSAVALITTSLYSNSELSLERSFRFAAVQVVSVITTTGFVIFDYTSTTPTQTYTFFILLFMGACAGSTSGGIKLVRHLVFVKNSRLEFKRLLHPRAIIRLKIDKKIVAPRILTHILVFLLLYLGLFVLGSGLMTIVLKHYDNGFLTAIGSVATCLGNVGPGIGAVGPLDTFAHIPVMGKWLLCALMLLGRLELFTVLIVFSPYFWRSN